MNTLQKELRFSAVCTVLLDVIVWLGSLPLCGLGITVPLGLLLGSAGMLCNLLLLRRTIMNAVYNGKTRDFGGYILRCIVASGTIALGLFISYINSVAVILPFLYPKIIFGIMAMRTDHHKNGGM